MILNHIYNQSLLHKPLYFLLYYLNVKYHHMLSHFFKLFFFFISNKLFKSITISFSCKKTYGIFIFYLSFFSTSGHNIYKEANEEKQMTDTAKQKKRTKQHSGFFFLW